MPTYRYRRVDETDLVVIVAASYELTSAGVAVFHDVTEENGALLGRTVDVRRVRIAGCVEPPERTDPLDVALRIAELTRAREAERQRLEALLRARHVATLPAPTPKHFEALSHARDVEPRRRRLAYSPAEER
jgi:hypothetical protein